jgi:type II secretory pathway pseudopilin PulG
MIEDSAKARGIIAILLLVSLIAVNVVLIVMAPLDEFSKTQLNTLNGALILQLGIVFGYYFGSSSGAKTLSQASIETNKTLVEKVSPGTGSGLDSRPAGTTADPVAVREVAPPADPEFEAFSEMVRSMNKRATDAEILAAWATIKSRRGDVDVDTSRAH